MREFMRTAIDRHTSAIAPAVPNGCSFRLGQGGPIRGSFRSPNFPMLSDWCPIQDVSAGVFTLSTPLSLDELAISDSLIVADPQGPISSRSRCPPRAMQLAAAYW